uniref:rod shape-determining protein MreC n=1 Tax=Aliarcobacter sp. TaxID=2321116 RepID=UPI004048ABE4
MRKFLFILLFIIASLSYLFEVDELLIRKFTFFNDLKSSYIDKVINITDTIEEHFEQASTIEKLKEENNELKEYKILYATTQKQLKAIKDFIIHIAISEPTPKIELVKVLSYINYNDFTKVWLDRIPEDDSISGLIIEDYAAGIVINKDGRSVGLLNGNKASSYAVFIGEEKIPGISTAAKSQDELLIKYIPIWSDIKKGDKVITSGMDNIFFEGLKVGEVVEVTSLPDMKTAIVKPYINVLKERYFYIYKSNKNIENINKTANN